MALTVVVSVSAGLAFRKSFRGRAFLFYTANRESDPCRRSSPRSASRWNSGCSTIFMAKHGSEGWTTAMGFFTSGLGAHLNLDPALGF